MKKGFLATCMLAGILSLPGLAAAATYTEVGDAGQLLGTSQALPGGTDRVHGVLNGDADLFSFSWGGGAFYVNTVDTRQTYQLDLQLFLFNGTGMGVQANDDGLSGYQGLPAYLQLANLAAGQYFLGVSHYDNDPLDSNGNLIFQSWPYQPLYGPNAGATALTSWRSSGNGYTEDYELNFAQVTDSGQVHDPNPTGVPEPGTMMLLGSGLVGLVALKRKK